MRHIQIFKQLAKSGNIGQFDNFATTYGLNGLYMTDQDTALEIALHNEYKMYENFTIMLDASYIAMWLADTKYDGVRRQLSGTTSEQRDNWNVNVSFVYSF